MITDDNKIYTVTAITRLIKYTLEESLRSVWIEGEISNYIHHSSGHRYCNLKDDNATIKLTVWRSLGETLRFEPENGMKVRAFGDITVYEKGGNYQLNVKKLMPLGVGELEVAFRQLYEKLSAEGLFDSSLKKEIPVLPQKVGVVTSPTGAAIRDIINIAQRRNDTIQLIIYPAAVQGKGAEKTIINGIKYFNSRSDIDLIIIGRGGGSLEDLWAFNEEALVRAIVDSEKPIVSGIGHEIDTTLSDLAVDLRAPTPSAAAEIVIWDKNLYLQNILEIIIKMDRRIKAVLDNYRQEIKNFTNRPVYKNPESLFLDKFQYLDNLIRLFEMAGKNILEKKKNSLSLVLSRLESLSPLAVLKRGYAITRDAIDGTVLKSIKAIKSGDKVETVLSDGRFTALVDKVEKSE